MALVVDASALYAQADRSDPDHRTVAQLLVNEREPLVTTELAVAEADYLILTRLGVDVELAFMEDLASGVFAVECLSRTELRLAREVAVRYRDLQPGLADCSLVVLAGRLNTRRIATLNTRDFRAMEPLQGGAFRLEPGDSQPRRG